MKSGAAVGLLAVLAACSGSIPPSAASNTLPAGTTPATTTPATTTPAGTARSGTTTPVFVPQQLLIGASSRSVLPTVDGGRDYLGEVPGSLNVDPYSPGLFVPAFDQGAVDVGNGNNDAAWVHDDLIATSVAIQEGENLVVLTSVDLYMVFAADANEIERRARANLPESMRAARIMISATHNHHGPDTAFSVNDQWYERMADETAASIVEAVSYLEPATLTAAQGEHRFGVDDARDPIILDPALNVAVATSIDTGDVIATIVQWTSHPETTLGYEPAEKIDISHVCSVKGWVDSDCYAAGRYLSADYPGAMRAVVRNEIGGEVLYFNGPLGSQIGPGRAQVWLVDDQHPVGNGWTPPGGAQPVPGAAGLGDQTFTRTEAIGRQLGLAVLKLVSSARAVAVSGVVWREQPFYTRLTNIGFRLLLADGDLGWQTPAAYTCNLPFSDDTCIADDNAVVGDPILTPLTGSQVRVGDVLKTRLVHLSLGDVGFLFMPGELPPELVRGLPADFLTNNDRFYRDPTDQHARGAAYTIPGYLLNLVTESQTFTVGLSGDELGYWVPLSEARMRCAADLLGPAGACQRAFAAGVIDYPDAVGGVLCKRITDDPSVLEMSDPELAKVAADSCRYGQVLGRELGEPAGHYEETNSAGWDLAADTWAAAVLLFGRADIAQINPNNPGYTPQNPPPAAGP